MAARLIEPTEVIEVAFVPLLIFGPPGCGKTTIAQTADNPLTLDFDEGIHRCANRKRAMRFETWQDCIDEGQRGAFTPYGTLIIDTGGRALDTMIPEILRENPKNGYRGNLSQPGWGALGSRFSMWIKTVRSWKKNVVMLCHEDDGQDKAGNPDLHPDLPGKMAWKEIHKNFDVIGRVRYDGADRILDFSPCEGAKCCKNAAHWQPMKLPDLHQHPDYLAKLLAEAKARMGAIAAESAAVAEAVSLWQDKLKAEALELEEFNGLFREWNGLKGDVRSQVWHLLCQRAAPRWVYDPKAKAFVVKEVAAELEDTR